MLSHRFTRAVARRLAFLCYAAMLLLPSAVMAQHQLAREQITYQVTDASSKIEMIVNSSRILTLEQKIPQAQVNNPDILEVTPLSPNQIQVFAKKPGVTQVNLWDEQETIHSLDVVVFGDARELAMVLQSQFPSSALKVVPLANSVVISGFVDNPDDVGRIIQVAEDFHPKVINNIRVGGTQQVLLHLKVMEVSRTKIRSLGFDWAYFNNADFVSSGISGILQPLTSAGGEVVLGGATASFGIVNDESAFFGFLEALRRNQLAEILAEPDLVTYSGRPAFFNVGGEFPVRVPQSLGTTSYEWKKYGTQIDFVPIVLGNGNIRLEVRPRISEIDTTRVVSRDPDAPPALIVREADTGAEMRAGQTMAIAGLIQNRLEADVRAMPLLGELPYVGSLFRRTRDQYNEVELLILVTPELVDALDAHDVPAGGPGMNTCRPNDWQFYLKGQLEVPCCDHGCQQCLPQEPVHGGLYIEGELLPPGMERLPAADHVGLPEADVPAPEGDRSARRPIHGAGQAWAGDSPTPATRGKTAASPRKPSTSPHPQNRSTSTSSETQKSTSAQPSLIGPLGYDLKN